MFTKTMKFEDLDGNEVEQTFYFNYFKTEIAELLQFGHILEYEVPGKVYTPLDVMLEKLTKGTDESGLTEQENTKQAYEIFRDLILDAYGEKRADNRGFDKNLELRNFWKGHVAFEEMIWEFVGNPALATQFIEACLPSKVVQETKAELQREAQAGGGAKLSSATITEMVEEAARRQEDPATRIEPGIEAAREVLGHNPEMEALAGAVKGETVAAPAIDYASLTPEAIISMPQGSFDLLDIQRLDKTQLQAAFRRKSQG